MTRSLIFPETLRLRRRAAEASGAGAAIIPQRRASLQPYMLTIELNPRSCWLRRRAAEASGAAVAVHGPIPQADLLAALGIGVRLESLLQGCRGEGAAAALTSGYNRRAPV